MREDGSRPTLLLAEDTALLSASSWSPDGKTIGFFAYGAADEELLKKYQLPFHFSLYVMNANDNGSGRERLIDVSILPEFAWSPDSQRLALVSGYEDPARDDPRVRQGLQGFSTAIYVFDFQSQRLRRITPLGENKSPSWSPDGRRIVYSGDGDIYVVDVDGRDPQRLTTRMRAVDPSWSPRGDLIAFSAVELPPKDMSPAQARAWAAEMAGELSEGVFLMRPDGSIERQIWTAQGDVAWSPDGRHVRVTFAGWHKPGDIPESVTVLIDVTTGAATELAKGVKDVKDVTFTPDGQSVVYRWPEAGGWNLYAVDLQGQNRKTLIDNPSDNIACGFSMSPLGRAR
jgi:Tol biopolymer transport system component